MPLIVGTDEEGGAVMMMDSLARDADGTITENGKRSSERVKVLVCSSSPSVISAGRRRCKVGAAIAGAVGDIGAV